MEPEELISLIKKGNLPPDVKLRKNKFGIISNARKIELISDKRLREMLSKLSYHYKPNVSLSEFTGIPAYGGIVTGIARIVLEAREIGKVGEGEIIVAPETTPDFIIGMKKAAAFVTNQGGITSHAAIVAREMQKPCVIATRIATEVIKDGDTIEVNANKGIVRTIHTKTSI